MFICIHLQMASHKHFERLIILFLAKLVDYFTLIIANFKLLFMLLMALF